MGTKEVLEGKKNVELNQKQVVAVCKYLYDFEQKKKELTTPEGEYAKFFKETKEMGKYKGWSDDQLTDALRDRKKTEVQLNIVSTLKYLTFIIVESNIAETKECSWSWYVQKAKSYHLWTPS